MARRMKASLYRQRDQQCIARDGDVCLLCLFEAKDPSRDPGPIGDPTLDHLNNRKGDHALRNLNRLCRGHNTAERNRHQAGSPRLLTAANVDSLRKKAAETTAKRAADKNLHKSPGGQGTSQSPRASAAPEPMARLRSEGPGADRDRETGRLYLELMNPFYRLWVLEQVKAEGSITQQDAVFAGAEAVDDECGKCADETALGYFKKITSRAGWLVEQRDARGRIAWAFRPGRDLEALEKKLRGRVKAIRDAIQGA